MSDFGATSSQHRVELNFLEDWREAMGEAKTALLQNPIPACVLVLLAVIETTVPIRLLDLVEECVILYLSCAIVKIVWLRLQRMWQPEFSFSDFKGFESRIVAVTFQYGLGTILLGLLFIVPGIWWGVRCSLALAIACIENKPASKALERSRELTAGHFWRTFRYMLGGPVLMMIPIIIASFVLGILEQNYAAELQASTTAKLFDVGLNALIYMLMTVWQLCLPAIMVRMYAALVRSQST